jgi:hypothetical protein
MSSINNLFKNESKVMLFLLAGPFIIGLILAFILPLIHKTNNIDSCLDAGGSFNYESCECDFKKSHPVSESHKCK